jgi:inorganic pyrophosphatase
MVPHNAFHRFRPHPWHGLSVGNSAPSLVHAFIEITPFDLVKYEIDKESGFLRVDRPQRTSSLPPALYGFIPRTYCGKRVQALMPGATQGDHDPLDICVISERPIGRAETLLNARVVGGLPMLDDGEADDKIIAILDCDHQWGHLTDLSELPQILVERLVHYFNTYKWAPGKESTVAIGEPYGRERAERVVTASMEDYQEAFPQGIHEGEAIDY